MPDNISPSHHRVRSSSKSRRRAKRKRRQKLLIGLQLTVLIVGLVGGLAFITYRIFRPDPVNTAKAITDDEFDPIEQYDIILDIGTAKEKMILLTALVAKPQRDADFAILTDLNERIVTVAEEVLRDGRISDQDYEFAALKQLAAIWKLYLLNIHNDVHDHFLCEQYHKAVVKFIESENPNIARDAHIGKLRYFTGETITGRNSDISHVVDAATEALRRFPDDYDVIEEVRRAHMQLINVNREQASEVANAVILLQKSHGSEDAQTLIRYLSDLTLLYDLGIGNLPSITEINTTVDDFYNRVKQLAENPDLGETAYNQLLNCLMFLEKRRHHDKATELGRIISSTSLSQTDEELAAVGRKIGDDTIQRNSLVGTRWQFAEADFRGQSIDNSQYSGTVTLIAMYPQRQLTPNFLKMMQSLERGFQGRNLRIVFVAVVDSESDRINVDRSVAEINALLITSLEKPNRYLQQCPTTRLPYLILVDKDGIVDSINVPVNALKTRIESLL